MDCIVPTLDLSKAIKQRKRAELPSGLKHDTARFTNSSQSSKQGYVIDSHKPSFIDSIAGPSALSKVMHTQTSVNSQVLDDNAEGTGVNLQDKITSLMKMTKIPSKFAREAYMRPRIIQRIQTLTDRRIPAALHRPTSALKTKYARRFVGGGKPVSCTPIGNSQVQREKKLVTRKEVMSPFIMPSTTITPIRNPAYLLPTTASQSKREEMQRMHFQKAFETLRIEQIKDSLIENSKVHSLCERVMT